MSSFERVEKGLPEATCAAHRFLSRANFLPITKADSKIIRDLVIAIVSCLLSIDEELVPARDVQEVHVALEGCVEKLGPYANARTPAAVFLLSGALVGRLDDALRQVALALDQLCEAVSANGVEAVTLPVALSRKQVELPVLQARAKRGEELARRLRELEEEAASAEGGGDGDGGVAAFKAVCAAMAEEGVAEAELKDPKARAKLASMLFDVGSEAEVWLTPEESNFIATVASALLYIEPRTPRIETGGCDSDVGSSGGGREGSPESGPISPPSRLVVQKSFLCPIQHRLMRDPVLTAAGHTYERAAIEDWLKEKHTDPCTREHLSSKTLTPNWSLKSAIEEWLTAAGMTYEQYDAMTDEDRVTVVRRLS